jgi:hypothetical protein
VVLEMRGAACKCFEIAVYLLRNAGRNGKLEMENAR